MHPLVAAIMAAAAGGTDPFTIGAGSYAAGFWDEVTVTASAYVRFNTDGTVDVVGSPVDVSAMAWTEWWAGAPSTGVGTGKYVRLVQNSGSALNYSGTASADTWYEISTARLFGMTNTTADSVRTGNFTAQLSYDGATVAKQITFDIQADTTIII